jgi:hypothetical protein
MRSMKSLGLEEIQSARRRCSRLYGLGRLGSEDHEFITSRLKEVEARIVSMPEITDEEELEYS